MTDRCLVPTCNRPLTSEESRRRGMGPVCWRRNNPPAPRIPTGAHPAGPTQLSMEDIVTTTQPRVFDVDAPEPSDVLFLRTHDGQIVERLTGGRYSLNGDDTLDWNDVAERAPLHEIVTDEPIDTLRDITRGLIADHARDTANIRAFEAHSAEHLRDDDLYVLEALIDRAQVDVTVTWPAP